MANKSFTKRIDTIIESMFDEDKDLFTVLRKEFPGLDGYLQRFGINPNELHRLGSGTQGSAYSDNSLVVKFTEDDQEAKASQRLMERNVPGITSIIHVGKFSHEINWRTWGRAQFYIIIQDLQNTKLTPEEEEIANKVGDFLVAHYHREDSDRTKQGQGITALMNKIPYTESNLDQLSTKLAKMMKLQNRELPQTGLMIARDIIKAVLRLYYVAGIRFFDVQPGNLGKDRDGNYVLFDIGVSTTKGNVPPYGVVESKFKTFDQFTDNSIEIVG